VPNLRLGLQRCGRGGLAGELRLTKSAIQDLCGLVHVVRRRATALACLQVKCMWNISPSQESLITSIVFCGTMIGAYSWGVLGDAKGRRVGFFGTAIFTFMFGLLSAASPNYMVRIL